MLGSDTLIGQISLFDVIIERKSSYKPGEWVEENVFGKELTFDEIADRIGNLIIIDHSTYSKAWYQVVKVEKIIPYEDMRRLVYYDGCHQRGLINEKCFDKSSYMPVKAWDIKK